MAANVGTQLLTLQFSRDDEIEADLVGLEMARARRLRPGGVDHAVGEDGPGLGRQRRRPGFLSTHPTGPDRMARLRENVPKVRGLYQQAVAAAPPVKAQVR